MVWVLALLVNSVVCLQILQRLVFEKVLGLKEIPAKGGGARGEREKQNREKMCFSNCFWTVFSIFKELTGERGQKEQEIEAPKSHYQRELI